MTRYYTDWGSASNWLELCLICLKALPRSLIVGGFRSKVLLALCRGGDSSLIIYLFIYLTFLLDVKHYIIFTEAPRVKKSMLGTVFSRERL